jgi:hypothetical protein
MPVMTKGPQGDDIVILSREEYDQLVAATNEDAADAEILRRSVARVESGEEETFSAPRLTRSLHRKRRWRSPALRKATFPRSRSAAKAATFERCASLRTR